MTTYQVAKITHGDMSVMCVKSDRSLLKDNKVQTLIQKFYQDDTVAGVYFCFPSSGDILTDRNPKAKKPWTIEVNPWDLPYGEPQMI